MDRNAEDLSPEELTYCLFLADYHEALASNGPLPDPTRLTPDQQSRLPQIHALLRQIRQTCSSATDPSPPRAPDTQEERPDSQDGLRTAPAAPPTPHPADLPRPFGRYTLLRLLGRGGMGVVYEAVHEALCKRMAVKVLSGNPLGQGQHAERFRREARTVASLRHPHIVAVHDAGEQDGVLFLAMQLVEGRSLDQFLAACGADAKAAAPAGEGGGASLPAPSSPDYPRTVARLGLQVALALEYAHERGVLHRDVKPSNLLLDEAGDAWVTDFGLARSEDDSLSLTASDQLVGTPRYLPPEAFDGTWLPASDVYGLGLTLYELLTLRPAFTATSAFGMFGQILRSTPPRPRQVNPLVPEALEQIVLRAMNRRLERRYASATELARDLQAFLAAPPRPPAPRRGWPAVCLLGLLGLSLPVLLPGWAPPGPAPREPGAGAARQAKPGAKTAPPERAAHRPGTITTAAGGPGAAALGEPAGVAVDAAGDVYFSEWRSKLVRKWDARTGSITAVAGGGAGEGTDLGDGGPATAARLSRPTGVAVDGKGNVYVADTNHHCVRKVDRTGTITTVAGTGAQGHEGDDGPAAEATLDHPQFLALDGAGHLYVSDGSNRVRKIDLGRAVPTIALAVGGGTNDPAGGGHAADAKLDAARGLACDREGNLYIANTNTHRVFKVDARTRAISAIAGNGEGGPAVPGSRATGTPVQNPAGLAFDSAGNLYVSTGDVAIVYKVDPEGFLSHVAGAYLTHGSAGDLGPSTGASLDFPCGLATDRAGHLFIADLRAGRIRKVEGGPQEPRRPRGPGD